MRRCIIKVNEVPSPDRVVRALALVGIMEMLEDHPKGVLVHCLWLLDILKLYESL